MYANDKSLYSISETNITLYINCISKNSQSSEELHNIEYYSDVLMRKQIFFFKLCNLCKITVS